MRPKYVIFHLFPPAYDGKKIEKRLIPCDMPQMREAAGKRRKG